MAIRTPHEYTSRRDRRQAAPETTFREAEYIDRLSKSRTPVVVKLIDGEEVRGWIEYYDRTSFESRATRSRIFLSTRIASNISSKTPQTAEPAGSGSV